MFDLTADYVWVFQRNDRQFKNDPRKNMTRLNSLSPFCVPIFQVGRFLNFARLFLLAMSLLLQARPEVQQQLTAQRCSQHISINKLTSQEEMPPGKGMSPESTWITKTRPTRSLTGAVTLNAPTGDVSMAGESTGKTHWKDSGTSWKDN